MLSTSARESLFPAATVTPKTSHVSMGRKLSRFVHAPPYVQTALRIQRRTGNPSHFQRLEGAGCVLLCPCTCKAALLCPSSEGLLSSIGKISAIRCKNQTYARLLKSRRRLAAQMSKTSMAHKIPLRGAYSQCKRPGNLPGHPRRRSLCEGVF